MSTTIKSSELTTPAATGAVAAPTRPGQRIVALDALRGFAILGILIMNIQSFSMIFAAYQNPAAYGDLTGFNRWVWIVGHLFFDLKFMAMFAMMFGAGILLITESAARKGISPARLHYTRNIWLLLFGLVHAYLFWSGDILAAYAVCGFVVYFFRRLSPRWLVVIGVALIAIPSIIQVLGQVSLPYMPVADYVEMRNDWQPTAAMVAEEVAAFRGEWPAQMEQRVAHSLEMHTLVFFIYMGWRVAGLMLLGVALYKWGVLTARRSRRFYARMSLVGFSSGLPLVIAGVWQNFAHDWDFAYSMFTGSQFNYWGSLPVSLGYIGLIMFIATSERMSALIDRLAAVGRMALTNYFLQTLIATTLFYGHGLGWFGQVERTGQLVIVLAIWAVQLLVSPIWLAHFRFGPFEWLWRSLTYRRWQPLRRVQPAALS